MEETLEPLVGEPVNVVSFVMDYVELGFNGPVLRFVSDPTVESNEGRFTFPDPGSRDALAGLIGGVLTSINVEPNEHLTLGFADARLIVPLDPTSRHQGEALHFVPGHNQPISVW